MNNIFFAFKQFLKFSLVGLSNTLISFIITYGVIFSVAYFFEGIVSDDFLLVFIASFLGFFVGVLNSYYWNNKYVFKKTTKGNLVPLLKSYVCYGVIFIFSYILNSFILKDIFGFSNIYIPVMQIFICTPLNFISNKLWAFK